MIILSGTMMMVVPSITTLQGQLEADAVGMGLTVLNLNKVGDLFTVMQKSSYFPTIYGYFLAIFGIS